MTGAGEPIGEGKRRRGYGCTVAAGLIAAAALLFFTWPYRLQTVVGLVSHNDTGCTIAVNQISDWQEGVIAPGLSTTSLKFPLTVWVFADACGGLPAGRPYAADLIAVDTGKVIATSKSCAIRVESDFPCRLEAPPIAAGAPLPRYILRVVRKQGEAARRAEIDVTTPRQWRSGVLDAIMSV